MLNLHIGNSKFDIYPLLDANEVIMKLHRVMNELCHNSRYKTVITTIEKYNRSDEKSVDGHGLVETYTLIVLKSKYHLKPNEIAVLFKEVLQRKQKGKSFNDIKFRGSKHGY